MIAQSEDKHSIVKLPLNNLTNP